MNTAARAARGLMSIAASSAVLLAQGAPRAEAAAEPGGERRVRSADGVEIAYESSGSGRTSLVFLHGGLADRSFWAPQVEGLSDRFRVVTLDLAGHGRSGRGRSEWTMAAWARDVRAVADALRLDRMVLVGNSLGGVVALETAALLRGRVIGVVAVDTLHDANQVVSEEFAQAQAGAFRKDFAGTCHALVGGLFHPGTMAELRERVERTMCATHPDVVVGMVTQWGGFRMRDAFARAGVPIRAINGDLRPTLTAANREVADFDAKIMQGCGHYPMLERPDEFNRLLTETVAELEQRTSQPAEP